MLKWEIAYKLDSIRNDEDYLDETTKRGLNKQLDGLVKDYGDRIKEIAIRSWNRDEYWGDELENVWYFGSVEKARECVKAGMPESWYHTHN